MQKKRGGARKAILRREELPPYVDRAPLLAESGRSMEAKVAAKSISRTYTKPALPI